jgi:formate/nitrite transporter FocA (FNT family)
MAQSYRQKQRQRYRAQERQDRAREESGSGESQGGGQSGGGQQRPQLRLQSTVVYDAIRHEGQEELRRPLTSLWWSGVAAGLGISTSIVAQGVLHEHLPDAQWRPLVTGFGYTVGFLIVVLGRLQLFTENTITVILPLLAEWSPLRLWQIVRLWTVVFAANLTGTGAAAGIAYSFGIATERQLTALTEISMKVYEKTPLETLLTGIPGGFLIAAMVWMMPQSRNFEFWTILTITYVIAIGGFSHVVAGSTEAFLLIYQGIMTPWEGLYVFLGPAFAGNVIGGTLLFALLAYGQVKEEM